MQRTNIRKPFRFPIEPGRLTNMLCAFYSVEVQKNGYEIENMESMLGNCREVAEFLSDAGKTKFGLILSGSVGNGKTTMLYALREAIAWVADCKNWNKYLCVADAREVANNYDKIKDLELLAIDDIGRESAEAMKYGNVINPIADLLEHRYRKRLFTMLTTNIPNAKLGEIYGDRVYDRCKEMFKTIVFKGKSYRK